MTVVTVNEGRFGVAGSDGTNGSGVANVRTSKIENPLISLLNPNKKSKIGTLTTTRLTQGAYPNRYGSYSWAHPDTATNLALHSQDFTNAVWTNPTTSWTHIASGITDPFGGSNAHEINLDVDTRNRVTYDQVIAQSLGVLTDESYCTSIWMKIISGVVDTVDMSYKDSGSWRRMDASGELSSTEWRRVADFRSPSGSLATTVAFNPRGDLNTRIAVYGAQVQLGTMPTDYIATTTASVTTNYTDQQRDSKLGYLIEESKPNLIQNPDGFEASTTTWVLTNGTLSAYNGQNAFGETGKYIQLNHGTVSTITLSNGATMTEGQPYTVSFWLLKVSGTLTDVSVSAKGGSPVPIADIPTVLTRVSAVCIAGAAGSVVISLTSPDSDAASVVSGVRVEAGSLTSYYEGTTVQGQRAADIYSIPYTIRKPDLEWTLSFNYSGVTNDALIKYVFHNGLTGVNEFALYFINDDIVLQIGTQTRQFNSVINGSSIVITFDGSLARLYLDGGSPATPDAFTPAVTTVGTTLYIGSDSTQTNAINAYLSNLEFWDFRMTTQEAQYIAGAK